MTTNKHLMLVSFCMFLGSMNALMTNHSGVAQGVWVISALLLLITATCVNEEAQCGVAEQPEPAKGDWTGETK